MTYNEYIQEVVILARELGYGKFAVMCFEPDIKECYNEGLTPQECVEREF